MKSTEETPRFDIGWAQLQRLDATAADQVMESLEEIAPDMARFIVEFAYGDVFSRPGLNAQSRQIATIAALAALGNAEAQLKFHIGAGLNIGITAEQVIEVSYLVTVFTGFPAGINAINAARQVFKEKGITVCIDENPPADRRSKGMKALSETSKGSGRKVLDSLSDIAPAMGEFILDFSYGDVISRPNLSPVHKEIAMIAAGVAKATMWPQVKVHIAAALNVGCTREAIIEIMIQMAVYAGFPAALNGIAAARDVFKDK